MLKIWQGTFIFTLLIVLSCSTRKVSLITPIKDVRVQARLNDKSWVDLGVAPLTLTESDLEKLANSKGEFYFRMSKPGHHTEQSILHLRRGAQVEINSDLEEIINWSNADNKELMRVLDHFGQQVQLLNRLIKRKELKLAQSKVSELLDKYPEVALLHDFQGTIFLLRGKRELAKKSYLKSLAIDPHNVKTREFLQQEFKADFDSSN